MDEFNLQDFVEIDGMTTITPTPKLPKTIRLSGKPARLKRVIKCPLTTKNAVKYLLEGTLQNKTCRYCLNVVTSLSELDQILHVAGSGTTYKVTIRDMIASFHPFKVVDEPNFPNRICDRCLDLAITSYLFTQQCERAERALRNCFDDIYEKVDKLDPLERKKRGRQKQHPNYNVIHAEHKKVIDYAEPIIHIINSGTEPFDVEPEMTELECTRCWQVLPDTESLLNHVKAHPKTMWHHCRLCGRSFPKLNQMKKHYHRVHILGREPKAANSNDFRCSLCAHVTENFKDHLRHMEKHKFKNVMENVVDRKLHQLCAVCLDKSAKLVDFEDMVCIHGAYPELMGDIPLFRVLASTLPDMDNMHDFLGTKICDRCLNHAITAYIFINQFTLSRERLDFCISHMLGSLENVSLDKNIFVEINENTIMPVTEDFDETLLLDEYDEVDESKIKISVLEDEFRLKSESESNEEDDAEPDGKDVKTNESIPDIKVTDTKPDENSEYTTSTEFESVLDSDGMIDNLAKKATKSYSKRNINGLHYTDICSEFLTFNKKTAIVIESKPAKTQEHNCPLCKKNFISDYFLKRHVAKHVNKHVICDVCNKAFQSKFYLREHKKVMHLMKATQHYSCGDCGRTFIKETKFKSHQKSHKRLACQFCGKTFANQTYFNSHLARHASKLFDFKRKKPDTCSFCEKECPDRTKLSIHINKVHFEIKPYSCDMCDRKFYAEYNMNRHRRVHSMISKETCVFCNKMFKCRKSLVNHVRKHIGAKPFGCQVCSQSFHSQFKVKQHMKVCHGGIYCCSMCKTTFMTKKGLSNHIENDHRLI